jgi:epoxide hydrolase-like predicted phosphatase
VIKAIIFDFFGVICSDEYWQFVKADKNDTDGQFNKLSNDLNLGNISWDDFVDEVARDTGQEEEQVRKMYGSQKINPDMVRLIGTLRKKYKTALLTNANKEQLHQIIQGIGLEKVFKEIIVSSDVGMVKPDERIFQLTLSKLQVDPQEAVFIDDISRYVYAAKDIGMHGIVYSDYGQMKAELMRLIAPSSDN